MNKELSGSTGIERGVSDGVKITSIQHGVLGNKTQIKTLNGQLFM